MHSSSDVTDFISRFTGFDFQNFIKAGVIKGAPTASETGRKESNVAYRHVAKRWLYKQRPLLGNVRNVHSRNSRTTGLCNPFLGNESVNTPLQQWSYCWKRCFLFGPCEVLIKKRIGATSSVKCWALQGRLGRDGAIVQWVELISAWEAVTSGPERGKLKNLHC
jgi:hypothetical protein